jgi:iron complex outermembrane receptor protein
LPRIEPTIIDWSATAGSRLERGPWHLDLSASHGGNRFDYSIANSVNASLGVDSPTRFDAGALQFSQSTGNVDLVRRFELGDARALSLVGGAELRREQYAIEAGQPESYVLGPETTSSGAPKTAGAQVFPGFQPDNEVDAARTSIGAYAGVESELGDALDLDAAGRYEAYSDFGQTATGKVAARYELADGVALRATVSTGFRAPSLHQVWFSSISTQTVENPETGALEPRQVLTSNNASDVAGAFGMPPLAEERSRSLSVGGSARLADRLTMTVDAYSTSIADRIVLTSRFTSQTPMVSEILSPFPGVSQAQFFANAVDTRTRGVDVVVDYRTGLGAGVLDLIGSANFNRTEVMAIHVPQSVADRFAGGDLGAVREVFLSREERGRLEEALPGRRATLHAKYSLDRLAIVSRARYFGPVRYRAADPDKDEFFGDKVIFDLDLGYALSPGWRLSLGGTNILNTFPDRQRDPENISFGRFPYSRRVSQFGLDGAFYYLRAQWLL